MIENPVLLAKVAMWVLIIGVSVPFILTCFAACTFYVDDRRKKKREKRLVEEANIEYIKSLFIRFE